MWTIWRIRCSNNDISSISRVEFNFRGDIHWLKVIFRCLGIAVVGVKKAGFPIFHPNALRRIQIKLVRFCLRMIPQPVARMSTVSTSRALTNGLHARNLIYRNGCTPIFRFRAALRKDCTSFYLPLFLSAASRPGCCSRWSCRHIVKPKRCSRASKNTTRAKQLQL